MDSGGSRPYGSVVLRNPMRAARVSPHRFVLIQFLLIVFFLILFFQVAQISFFYQSPLLERAVKQHRLVVEIPPMRGGIYDRNTQGLAINLKVPSIYAAPRLIDSNEKETLAAQLAEILSLSHSVVRERLGRDKSFIWLKRRVTMDEARQIQTFNHPAIGILHEYKRFYPNGSLLAHVLGFTDVDSHGIEGIERLQDA